MLGLGPLAEPPEPLTGGHLHRMYALRTDNGRYAVKALNPQVMARPAALQAIVKSERIAGIAARHIPAAPALTFGGSAVQALDGQYYLVFDWLDGRSLGCGELCVSDCQAVGRALAVLHSLDFGMSACDFDFQEPAVDWSAYLRLGEKADAEWTEPLRMNIGRLDTWSARLERASRALPGALVISHCDLEPKNVLWRGETPVVIDWEAAGFIHPAHDLVETAVYWSKDDSGHIGEGRFKAFLAAYREAGGTVSADWEIVLAKGFSSLSGWLEYSLKRSLGIEACDEAERRMGTEHVFNTIRMALEYFETVPSLLRWLDEL